MYLINEKIPIVVASDENYAPYMYVTILSILKNKNKTTNYDIYILLDKQFPQKLLLKFNKLAENFDTTFNYIIMKDEYSFIEMRMNHITTPTYYRLSMPSLLEKYKKAIYLDTDLIVQKDLSEYFNIDISSYYIAGVKAASYIINYELLKEYYKKINLKNINEYINAGVTLWNLDKIRKTKGKLQELYNLAQKGLKSQDQDVINIAFQGGIKILPLKYNLMTKYEDLRNSLSKIDKNYLKIWDEEQIKDALNEPVIVHYCSPEKPWMKKVWLDDFWWKYAKNAPFPFWFRKNIFSMSQNSKHYILNILGLKIKFKNKKDNKVA